MTKSNRFWAGTALCLLMAAPVPAQADAAHPGTAEHDMGAPTSLMLAQAEDPNAAGQEGGAECPPGTAPADGGCAPVDQAQPPAEEQAPEPAPEEEPAAEEQPASEPEAAPAEEAPAEEAAPTEEQPPVQEEPAPEPQAQPEEVPAEEAAPTEEQAPLQQEAPVEEQAPVEDAAPAEEQAPAQEEAPAADQAPVTEEAPITEEAPAGQEAPATEDAPAAEETTPMQPEAAEPAEEGTEPTQPAPAEEAPAGEEAAPAPGTEQPATEPGAGLDGEQPTTDGQTEEQAQPGAETPPEGEEALPENAAPVLDSQKEAEQPTGEAQPTDEAQQPAESQPMQPEQQQQAEPAQEAQPAPLPESDAQAQQDLVNPEQVQQEIRSIVEEQGQRIELGQTPEDRRVRRREMFQPREAARVVEEFNDNRTIVEINNHIYVESPDYDRIVRRDDQVYYEELRGGRVREVIERSDGTRVITVRNRYGDVIRRVRVTPEGREYVLVYVPDDRYDDVLEFRDPARDLPPLQLTIPVSEYILEAESVDDPQRYYEFLEQPPVEPVTRLYSLEEVRYSARVRDMVRRIDLDSINFEFGSASISESEIPKLEGVATAMQDILERNPAETFLIEGHTDAVGSEVANLALSDRRAEAVAQALTNVFGIPPENLVTQGYGEQYLKINTEQRERENRRVAIRRITPLVAPVASNR
ncbi:OmpA family protein [Chelativorans sp. AA-79]|uniref:OmpA family protein n=1 Tax=Chelativorans sp. AA-79 TaxID=3028735 RepID=UPI0023F8D25B|nr:OmpA family protein [Chelativorans sp. AA-79]WEX11283.1 OmpA family protein [Chelativorans sp. AA-79]